MMNSFSRGEQLVCRGPGDDIAFNTLFESL